MTWTDEDATLLRSIVVGYNAEGDNYDCGGLTSRAAAELTRLRAVCAEVAGELREQIRSQGPYEEWAGLEHAGAPSEISHDKYRNVNDCEPCLTERGRCRAEAAIEAGEHVRREKP